MSHFINTALLPISLAIIMLGIGLSIKPANFTALKQQKLVIVAGFVLQVVALPVLALLLIYAFDIRGHDAVAIMIIACCPGGVTSNALTFIFSGIVALSVVLTLLSSLVAPLTVPLMTDWSLGFFIGDSAQTEFVLAGSVGKLLVLSVVPIIIGNMIRYFTPTLCAKYQAPFRRFSRVLFLTVILLMAIANAAQLSAVVSRLGLFILVMVACAIALGYWGGCLWGANTRQRLTLAIEVGIQNAGMGLIITGGVLNQPAMSAVLITYGIVMQLPMLGFIGWHNYRQQRQRA